MEIVNPIFELPGFSIELYNDRCITRAGFGVLAKYVRQLILDRDAQNLHRSILQGEGSQPEGQTQVSLSFVPDSLSSK